jgi:L-threonylcarbamoyladenylate synthase
MTASRVLSAGACCAEESARAAAEALAAGGLVVLPTDTVYGLAARADDEAAVARIFATKRRPPDRPLPVLIADTADLDWVAARVSPGARAFADAFWPGPLTLVIPRSDRIPDWVTAGAGSVGVRVPDHPLARLILRLCDFPVAVTSANLSDEPTASTAAGCAASLALAPELIIEAGVIAGAASTVVEVTDCGFAVLRQGVVAEDDLRRALAAAAPGRDEEEGR